MGSESSEWGTVNKATGPITAVLAAVVLLSGCGGSGSQSPTTASLSRPASSSSSTSAAVTSAAVTTSKTVAAPTVPAATSPISPPAIGGITVNPAGAVLPNHGRTPGAVNALVSQANIGRTICVSGWTATIRPPASVTTDLKVQQLASGYTYNRDTSTRDYEEDHLISLEIGGAPSAEANLWPEPYNAPEGARVKDVVENKLHALVCDHAISLATAQKAIATNWWVAYQTYVRGASSGSTNQAQPAPAAPAQAPVQPGNGATALCHDGTYSFAAHHQGACSGHGGVSVFYK
jgi:Protein of unknown function (DUF3761)